MLDQQQYWINKLKEIAEFKLEIEKEKLLKMENGKESFTFDKVSVVAYISSKNVTVYIDSLKSVDETKIKNKLNFLFNRQISVKKTFLGYVIPKNFHYTKKGMSIVKTKKEKINGEIEEIEYTEQISDKWIFIVSKVYSKEYDSYQSEVKTIDPVTKDEIVKLCNKDTLARISSCVTFLSTQLNVSADEGKKTDYTKFFFEFMLENGKFLEIKNTVPVLGWNDDFSEFLPYSEKLHLDYSKDKHNFLRNLVNSFNPPNNNNIKEAKTKLLKHSENPHSDFIISCGFAAPLLKIIGVRSFIVNIYGESKTQKSLTARIALSIFGKYTSLEMSGTDTKNVIKSKINKLQNILCYIDEIVQKGTKYNNVINGYDFGNERDRGRLDQYSEIKESKTWRTIAICSSESSIQQENDMSGEINRALSLHVDCRLKEMKNDEILCHEYAADYYRFLETNYSGVGNRYIEEIIKIDKKLLLSWYKQINKKLYEVNENQNLTDHISSISAVCLGNYVYRKILFNIDDIFYSIFIGKLILKSIGSKAELNAQEKFLDAVYSYYEVNKVNFIVRGEDSKRIKPNQIFGAIDNSTQEIIFILAPLREHIIKAGFDWNYKTTLIQNGLMKYLTKKINNIAAKRIIIPINRVNLEEELEEAEEREAIQEEMKVLPFK